MKKTTPLSDLNDFNIPAELRVDILKRLVSFEDFRDITGTIPFHPKYGHLPAFMSLAVVCEAVLTLAQTAGSTYIQSGGCVGLDERDNGIFLLFNPDLEEVTSAEDFDDSEGINLNATIRSLMLDEDEEDGSPTQSDFSKLIMSKSLEAIEDKKTDELHEWSLDKLPKLLMASPIGFDMLTVPMAAKQFGTSFEPIVNHMQGIATTVEEFDDVCEVCGAGDGEPCGLGLDDFMQETTAEDPQMPPQVRKLVDALSGIDGAKVTVLKNKGDASKALGQALKQIFGK